MPMCTTPTFITEGAEKRNLNKPGAHFILKYIPTMPEPYAKDKYSRIKSVQNKNLNKRPKRVMNKAHYLALMILAGISISSVPYLVMYHCTNI